MRSKLETYAKECSNLKKENAEFKKLSENLQKQTEDNLVKSECVSVSNDSVQFTQDKSKSRPRVRSTSPSSRLPENSDDFVSQLLSRKDRDQESCSSKDSEMSEQRKQGTSSGRGSIDGGLSTSKMEDPLIQQKLFAVKVKLEEAQKTIQAERE